MHGEIDRPIVDCAQIVYHEVQKLVNCTQIAVVESVESMRSTSFEGRCLRFVPDIVLTTLVVILVVGGPHFIRAVEYHGGLHGRGVGQSFLLALALRPLAGLLALLVAMLAVARLLLGPRTLKHAFLRFSFVVICLSTFLIPIQQSEPLAAIYLQGFERRVLTRVDIPAIQQGLMAQGDGYAGQTYREQEGDLPFSPALPGGGAAIEFRWYAPHGENYGLVVGPPAMDITNVVETGALQFRRSRAAFVKGVPKALRVRTCPCFDW